MTATAQSGILGFGPSAGKGQGVATGSWYRHKAVAVDLGVLDDTRVGPPEVGGRPVPTIPYKGGYAVGGGATINPRLEGSLGWLLGGAWGAVATTSGSGSIKRHKWTLDSTNPAYVPWVGFRKFIPSGGNAGDYSFGETYKDCKIVNFMLTLPNDGLISARVDALGRDFLFEASPSWGISSGSTGGWAPTTGEFESYESIPIGCQTSGFISVPTFGELPVIQAQIGIVNTPLDIRMERVFGDPMLEDITVVSRALTFDLTVKWRNPDLYRAILAGSTTGTVWDATPFVTQVDVTAISPDVMPSTTEPYMLEVYAQKVMLALQGPIQLAGNQAVLMRFVGTALDIVSGDYAYMRLTNKVANYTWPT